MGPLTGVGVGLFSHHAGKTRPPDPFPSPEYSEYVNRRTPGGRVPRPDGRRRPLPRTHGPLSPGLASHPHAPQPRAYAPVTHWQYTHARAPGCRCRGVMNRRPRGGRESTAGRRAVAGEVERFAGVAGVRPWGDHPPPGPGSRAGRNDAERCEGFKIFGRVGVVPPGWLLVAWAGVATLYPRGPPPPAVVGRGRGPTPSRLGVPCGSA